MRLVFAFLATLILSPLDASAQVIHGCVDRVGHLRIVTASFGPVGESPIDLKPYGLPGQMAVASDGIGIDVHATPSQPSRGTTSWR